MAVKASPEIIREMEKEIVGTARDLGRISTMIRNVLNGVSDWDDEQSVQFIMLMKKIAELTEEPIETLQASVPKMERLAEALEAYSRVKFQI